MTDADSDLLMSSGQTTPAGTPSANLPDEVIEAILAFVPRTETAPLARVHSNWQVVAEPYLWTHIHVSQGHSRAVQFIPLNKAMIQDDWRCLLQSLTTRPARAKLIHALYIQAIDPCVDAMGRVLELCAPTLTTIERDYAGSEDFDELDLSSLTRAIAAAASLPMVTTLRLTLGSTWERDIFLALRSTPNVELLGIDVYPTDSPTPETRALSSPDSSLRLLKLRVLNIFIRHSQRGVAALLSIAPNVEKLVFSQHGAQLWNGDRASELAMLRNKRTTELKILVESMCERFVEGSRRENAKPLFPRLEKPDLAGHATLSFNWRGDSYTSTNYHGSAPSQTSTGLIASWMIRVCGDLPSLSTIYLAPDLWPQEPEDRKPHILRLRSYFCEGSDILYHIVQYIATNFAMLGTREPAPIFLPEEDARSNSEALGSLWKAFRRPHADVVRVPGYTSRVTEGAQSHTKYYTLSAVGPGRSWGPKKGWP